MYVCVHRELEMTGGHWSYSEQVANLIDTLATGSAMMLLENLLVIVKKNKRFTD